MRLHEKAVADMAGLEQIIAQGRVCQLAISDVPVPYIVSLSYGYRSGEFYFHSAAEGHKIDLLRCNPLVGFTVAVDLGTVEGERACNWGAGFRSVVGQGRVEFIEDLESKRTALKLLMAQYGEGDFDFPRKAIEGTTIFRLVIKEMTGKQSMP
jgi:nitroimidazol reductase NimA-like FMN-containing flavoprotein (pyridoxamine 5'-phosphate oxidase superfamily)